MTVVCSVERRGARARASACTAVLSVLCIVAVVARGRGGEVRLSSFVIISVIGPIYHLSHHTTTPHYTRHYRRHSATRTAA
jgi:hypothetical protein